MIKERYDMELYSISELNIFCKSNNVLEYRLESNSYSEELGSVSKLKLSFDSVVFAEEFGIIYFKDNENKNETAIMCIDRIEKITDTPDDVQLFYIYCGYDEKILFKLYMKLNNNSINKLHTYVCNKCNNEFDLYDIHNGIKIRKRMGYGSLYDEDTVELNLCTKCFDKLINDCINSPIVN